MEPHNPGNTATTQSAKQAPPGAAHIPAVPPTYQQAVPHTQQLHPNLLSLAASAPQLDPNSLFIHPHAAAAVAAVAAAAAQQMVQAQSGAHHVQLPTMAHPAPAPTPLPPPAPPVATSSPSPTQQHLATSQPHAVPQPAPAPAPHQAFPGIPPHVATVMGLAPHQPVPPSTSQKQTQSTYPPVVAQPPTSMPQVTPNSAAVAAAAAQVVAAHAAANASSGAVANALLANMQNWKLEQLEAHVQWLRDSNQPIPQPVAMLLADARRKEEKRTAKRVANRKSACTSRARKKALVEEMTRTNARLKRQALILALLPDLVIAITIEGVITFCSAQVERVLRYKIDDLIGANLSEILVPASRPELHRLVEELVAAERAASTVVAQVAGPNQPEAGVGGVQNECKEEPNNGNGSGQSSSGSGGSSHTAAVVSEQSFPMAIVKVESSGVEENSDLSTSNSGRKNTAGAANSSSQSVTADEGRTAQTGASDQSRTKKKRPQQAQASSDDSLSSSSDAKNLYKANENLNRNVRWHNEMLSKKSKGKSSKAVHKDDVTGASVTANNADARLSSLQHKPDEARPKKVGRPYESLEEHSSTSSDSLLAGVEEKKKHKSKQAHGNSSDDSGYRESNESAREDTSSSASDSSNAAGRRGKPLAPTCNVCLIRNDLTTIWCEVTSSIRTRSLKEESGEISPAPQGRSGSTTKAPSVPPEPAQNDEIKELLLCLRPVRDGEETVDESLRFVRQNESRVAPVEGAATSTSPSTNATDSNSGESGEAKRPMKKRPLADQNLASVTGSEGEAIGKKAKTNNDETEKSVVESLILMSNKPTERLPDKGTEGLP